MREFVTVYLYLGKRICVRHVCIKILWELCMGACGVSVYVRVLAYVRGLASHVIESGHAYVRETFFLCVVICVDLVRVCVNV